MNKLEKLLIFLIPALLLVLFAVLYLPFPGLQASQDQVKGVYAQTPPNVPPHDDGPTEEDFTNMMDLFKAATTIMGGGPGDDSLPGAAPGGGGTPGGGGSNTPGTIPNPGNSGAPGTPGQNAGGLQDYGNGQAYIVTQSYDGYNFDRCLVIQGNNITIKNSVIRGNCTIPVINDDGNSGNVFERNTIVGGGPQTAAGIICSNCKVLNNDISNAADGIKLTSNMEVRGNYIHNLAQGIGAGGRPTHNDGMQSQGGSNVIIDGNTIDGNTCPPANVEGCNGAIYLQPTGSSPITGYTITNNAIAGRWPYFGIYLHPGSDAGIQATISGNTCTGSFQCVKTL